MEVEFEVVPEDVVAFSRYHQKRLLTSPMHIKPVAVLLGFLASCLLGGVLAFGAIALSIDSFFLNSMLFAAFIGMIICWIAICYYGYWTLSRTALAALKNGKDAEKVLGWERVMLDEQGLHVTSRLFSFSYKWNGIDKVATVKEYIFIYVTTTSAQIIPLRAFADGRAFDAFADAAKRYHGAARIGDAGEQDRRRPTGFQTSEQTRKFGTAQGIIPKERG